MKQPKDRFPYFYDPKLSEEMNLKVNAEIVKYAGMLILKKLDPMAPPEARYDFNIPLEGLDQILEPVLDDLYNRGFVEIDTAKAKYVLTPKGDQYIQTLIDEAEWYISKYQEFEPKTRVAIMKNDGVNLLRARFLWGWYDGEFDDLEAFQEERGITPVRPWQEFLVSKEFYDILFEDVIDVYDLTEEEIEELKREAERLRQERLQGVQPQPQQVTDPEKQRILSNYEVIEEEVIEERREPGYAYYDPYYYNPFHDPLFWLAVFML